jgi:ankyrin repeat protein
MRLEPVAAIPKAMNRPMYYEEEDALVTATYLRELGVFERLVKRGTNLNCRDGIGQTPLHAAADRGWKDLVERLLELGADPNLEDFAGDTPLDIALFREHSHIAQLLSPRATHLLISSNQKDRRGNANRR